MLTSSSSSQKTSQRARELDPHYRPRYDNQNHPNHQRRGHAPQISISDDSHHVTDAIGSMYGDEDDYAASHQPRPGRPLSFVPSPLGDTIQPNDGRSLPQRPGPLRTPSHEKSRPQFGQPGSPDSYGSPTSRGGMTGQSSPNSNGNGASSPTTSLNRSPSEASQHFPMTDLDSQAAVAQELSNLQAIRRMSMDVHSIDPDLPSFNPAWNVPTIAPSHDADEEDPSRLFWVPASVHPELAPKAFETFVQDRVKTIKRSSLSSEASLSPSSGDSSSSLRRKKSMLSRQVHDSSGYQDGAERLERKRNSIHRQSGDQNRVSLQDLEELAHDPSSLVRRLSIDGSRSSSEAAPDAGEAGDMPIMPPMPPGQTLKRSTRTTYRRGSQRKGDRLGKTRGLRGVQPAQGDEPPMPAVPSATEGIPQLPAFSSDLGSFDNGGFGGLQRVQTEPVKQNFSRPGRKPQSPPTQHGEFGGASEYSDARPRSSEERKRSPPPQEQMYPPRGSSARSPPPQMQVPTIVETPPAAHEYGGRPHAQTEPASMQRPERTSSMDQPPSAPPQTPLPNKPGQQRPQLNRPASLPQSGRSPQNQQQRNTMDHGQMGQNVPSQSTRTDALSIIPTYQEEKRKSKEEDGTRKTSWSLFSSKDKDKEKEKDAKKSKQKLTKGPQPQHQESGRHDDTRLDLLQTSIDGGKGGRESLVLDRQSLQLEQPKQTGRKTSSDGKKEKDSGLFSSLFGGGKKKGEKEHSKKSASSLRGLSPEPPQRKLQPDIDYNWTRFSILEERAIYRMAHIKLANPRRELYSQVLLSNFMYSYLAKVQQMHPQIQVPQSPAQKKASKKAQQEQQKGGANGGQAQAGEEGGLRGSEEMGMYQRYQEQQARGGADSPSQQQQSNGGGSSHSQRDRERERERGPPPQQQPQSQESPPTPQDEWPRSSSTQGYGNNNGGYSSGEHWDHAGGSRKQEKSGSLW